MRHGVDADGKFSRSCRVQHLHIVSTPQVKGRDLVFDTVVTNIEDTIPKDQFGMDTVELLDTPAVTRKYEGRCVVGNRMWVLCALIW